MYQKKPKSQREYEIEIDKMEKKVEWYETEHHYLNREFDTAKRESFRLLDTVKEVDGMMKGIEEAIHPFANQGVVADIKKARANLKYYVDIRQACEPARVPRQQAKTTQAGQSSSTGHASAQYLLE
jgi:uncharacterized protein YdcH (DUF465 family)